MLRVLLDNTVKPPSFQTKCPTVHMLPTPSHPLWPHCADSTLHSKLFFIAASHYWVPTAKSSLITILDFCEPQWYLFVRYFSNINVHMFPISARHQVNYSSKRKRSGVWDSMAIFFRYCKV